ncbi:MAG: hypothetical protein DRO06_03905 [Thermoproteota archaeon]|nr:MAG: hypothetical protein DRO06_03905 [Candidatus Korarchaeota archaeon]
MVRSLPSKTTLPPTILPEREMIRIRGGKIGMVFQDPLTSRDPLMRVGDQVVETIMAHKDVTREEAEEEAKPEEVEEAPPEVPARAPSVRELWRMGVGSWAQSALVHAVNSSGTVFVTCFDLSYNPVWIVGKGASDFWTLLVSGSTVSAARLNTPAWGYQFPGIVSAAVGLDESVFVYMASSGLLVNFLHGVERWKAPIANLAGIGASLMDVAQNESGLSCLSFMADRVKLVAMVGPSPSWAVALSPEEMPGPVKVGGDGTVYMAAGTQSGASKVLAFRGGSLLWSHQVGDMVMKMAPAPSGELYVVTTSGVLRLGPGGVREVEAPPQPSGVLVGSDGILYLADFGGGLRAVRGGRVLWEATLPAPVTEMAQAPDGSIFAVLDQTFAEGDRWFGLASIRPGTSP